MVNRTCLIDGDVILYEVGYAAEASWKYSYPEVNIDEDPPPFDKAEELVLSRIASIELSCEATNPSILFFTGKTNFRNEIAKRTQYKERASKKPYHYYNLKAYLKSIYAFQQVEGLEADDLMAIYQTDRRAERDTIICSRDKDLVAVAGWHYQWELGKQPEFGPYFVDGYGSISWHEERKKLIGYGSKFFLAQCIMGDVVDSIPGLPKYGPKAALDILGHTNTYTEGLQAVYEAYRSVYGDSGYRELLEQAQLLWLCRHPEDRWTYQHEG